MGSKILILPESCGLTYRAARIDKPMLTVNPVLTLFNINYIICLLVLSATALQDYKRWTYTVHCLYFYCGINSLLLCKNLEHFYYKLDHFEILGLSLINWLLGKLFST